jgi:hypothetical protein
MALVSVSVFENVFLISPGDSKTSAQCVLLEKLSSRHFFVVETNESALDFARFDCFDFSQEERKKSCDTKFTFIQSRFLGWSLVGWSMSRAT